MADFGLEGAYGSLLPADYYKSVGLKKRANGDMVTWDVDPDPMANLLRGMARGVRGQVDAVEKRRAERGEKTGRELAATVR
jgi:hypothetical protein